MKATVIIPTTGDRGPILEYSVGSVLQQTVNDWELFIVGDGLDKSSSLIAEEIADSDPRISFFSFPKNASRGEVNRDKVLREHGTGEIVCYLCDRDLYLENHIEVMYDLLQDHDFGHSLWVNVEENGRVRLRRGVLNETITEQKRAIIQRNKNVGLSIVAHRRDAYAKLPYGWRETPKGIYTDCYMWEQFYREEWVRCTIAYEPTVVYLSRGSHPGLPTKERVIQSKHFFDLYCSSDGVRRFQKDLNKGVFDFFAAREMKKIRKSQRSLFYKLRLRRKNR